MIHLSRDTELSALSWASNKYQRIHALSLVTVDNESLLPSFESSLTYKNPHCLSRSLFVAASPCCCSALGDELQQLGNTVSGLLILRTRPAFRAEQLVDLLSPLARIEARPREDRCGAILRRAVSHLVSALSANQFQRLLGGKCSNGSTEARG
eukprot:4284257-Amphidinium_carterae.1